MWAYAVCCFSFIIAWVAQLEKLLTLKNILEKEGHRVVFSLFFQRKYRNSYFCSLKIAQFYQQDCLYVFIPINFRFQKIRITLSKPTPLKSVRPRAWSVIKSHTYKIRTNVCTLRGVNSFLKILLWNWASFSDNELKVVCAMQVFRFQTSLCFFVFIFVFNREKRIWRLKLLRFPRNQKISTIHSIHIESNDVKISRMIALKNTQNSQKRHNNEFRSTNRYFLVCVCDVGGIIICNPFYDICFEFSFYEHRNRMANGVNNCLRNRLFMQKHLIAFFLRNVGRGALFQT